MSRCQVKRARRFAAWSLLGIAVLLGGCVEPPGETDAGGVDAAVDAAVDAGPPPITLAPRHPVALDICALPFFKIPFDGTTTILRLYSISRNRLAWTQHLPGATDNEIRLLDLDTCEETLVSDQVIGGSLDLWGSSLVWTDGSLRLWDYDLNKMVFVWNLVLADLDRWEADWIVYGETSSYYAQINDDYLAFVHKVDHRDLGPTELWLLQRDTGEATLVAGTGVGAIWPSLGERYLGYVGYHAGGEGFDVHYYDTWTGQTTWLEATGPDYQEALQNVGDYLAWFNFPPSSAPPYRVDAYHIPSGRFIRVTDNEYDSPMGALGPPVVAYSTTKYDPPEGYYWDVAVYDLESGARRRLTWQAGTLHPVRMAMPYLLLVHLLEPQLNGGPTNLYIANLEALGVLDADGHVIAGDPVIEQPPLPDPL